MADGTPELKQELRTVQIFFIVVSSVIGGGIFTTNGEVLELAGPGGLLLAILVVGLMTIMVMECISEFIQLFPAPNAIVEYVAAFVDEDLGWVIGIAYWYTYSSIFAIQNLAAANLSAYWGLSQLWQTICFYFIAPAIILIINFMGVFTFGILETIGGILKVLLIFGGAIFMFVIAAKQNNASPAGPINDGFQNNILFAPDHNKAMCYVLPLVAFGFLGVEIVAVTAFEAKDSRSLRVPSQTIAYVILFFYILYSLGEALNIKWSDSHLPFVYGGISNGTDVSNSNATDVGLPNSNSMTVLAAWQANLPTAAGFLNGCLIFSVLSAANSSLYVASRTLYGLTRTVPQTNWFGRQIHKLSVVEPKTGVPIAALLVSAVSFFWLPFLQLKGGYGIQVLIAIMSISASVSCLIVWAVICVAFIRYVNWLKLCKEDIARSYPEFNRNDNADYQPITLFRRIQPAPAYLGLIGCILVLAFTSATWWNSPATFSKVAIAYAAPIILLPIWLLLKLITRRSWVKTGSNIQPLAERLNKLGWLKRDQPRRPRADQAQFREHEPRRISPTPVTSPVGKRMREGSEAES